MALNGLAQPTTPEMGQQQDDIISSGELDKEQTEILSSIRDLEPRVDWDRSPLVEFELEEAHQEYGEVLVRFYNIKKAEDQHNISGGSQPTKTGVTVALLKTVKVRRSPTRRVRIPSLAPNSNIFSPLFPKINQRIHCFFSTSWWKAVGKVNHRYVNERIVVFGCRRNLCQQKCNKSQNDCEPIQDWCGYQQPRLNQAAPDSEIHKHITEVTELQDETHTST